MNLQRGTDGSLSPNGISVNAMGQALHRDYSDHFEKVAQCSGGWDHLIASGDKHLIREAMFAQHEFPEMFTYKIMDVCRLCAA